MPDANDATPLERAHAAAASGHWQAAYDALIEEDARSGLVGADLPLLAGVAYATGHLDVTIEAWERAYRAAVEAGEAVAAAGAAVRVAMHLLFDSALLAPVRGWLARAEKLLPSSGDTPVHAWLAVVRNYERLLSGDFTSARAWARRAIEVGAIFDPAAAAIGRVAEARSLILQGDVSEGLGLLNDAAAAMLIGDIDPLSTGVATARSSVHSRPSASMTSPNSGPKRWNAGATDSLWEASTAAVAFTARRSSGSAEPVTKRRARSSPLVTSFVRISDGSLDGP
jgi:hypothetical protein